MAQGFGETVEGHIEPGIIVDHYPGSDNGAKINAAVSSLHAAGGRCRLILTRAGIISTAPNLPVGCELHVEAEQTLTTSWTIVHHGVTIDFHGQAVTFTGKGPAFDIGKPSSITDSGTANTSATEKSLTWVDGPLFDNFDTGDQVCLHDNGCFNIASIDSARTMTLTLAPRDKKNVRFAGLMVPENAIGNNPTTYPVVIRNLILLLGEGGNGDAIRSTFTSNITFANIRVKGAFTWCYESRGSLSAKIYDLACSSSGISFNSYTAGGFTSGSNSNGIFGADVVSNLEGAAISFQSSSSNIAYRLRLEGNFGVNAWEDVNGANNACYGCYFERNGNGTASSSTILIRQSNNALIDSAIILDSGSTFNNGGNAIQISGLTPGVEIRDVTINGHSSSFGSAIACFGGGGAILIGNTYQGSYSRGVLNGCSSSPYIDTAGNFGITGLLQTSNGNLAGTCSMHAATSCTFHLGRGYSSSPICITTIQNATAIAGSCVVSGSTVTIHAARANSFKWGAVIIGNPN